MFFHRKRYSLIEAGLFQGMTDYHCHILPGVDDGVQTLDEALKALLTFAEMGIREVWLTPHIMEDYPNNPADLRQRFEELRQHLSTLTSRPAVHLAAEHMLDTLFSQRLDSGNLLPYTSSDAGTVANSPLSALHSPLLIETSYFSPPMHLYGMIDDICHKGYTPLLAHPERYQYMSTSDYRHLRDMGVPFQLNLLSLCGAYGGDAAHKSRRLLREGAYTLCGTDLHSLNDFLDYANAPCLTKSEIQSVEAVLK
jgi:tyrosine-protein phosphatase YwqE